MDLTAVTTPLLQAAGAVLAVVVPIYVRRLVQCLDARLELHTEQADRDKMEAALDAAAGSVLAAVMRGELKPTDVRASSPHVEQATNIVRQVGVPVNAQERIVARVAAMLAADPTTTTVPANDTREQPGKTTAQR